MIQEAKIVPLTQELIPLSTTILQKIASVLTHLLKTGGEKACMFRILNGMFVAYNVQMVIVEDDNNIFDVY
jgi:hypothetical protein